MFSLLKIDKIENAILVAAGCVPLWVPAKLKKRKGMYLSCVCLVLWPLCHGLSW